LAAEAAPAAPRPSALKQLLLKPKPCSIVLLLKDSEQTWYPSKLARSSGASYVHVINLLSGLKKFGIVASEKKGKQNMFHLTEKGAYLALTLDDLAKKCEAAEAEHKQAKQEAPPPHPIPEAAVAKSEKAASAAGGAPSPEAKREAKPAAEKK
jgi:predicted transcriptional regulator